MLCQGGRELVLSTVFRFWMLRFSDQRGRVSRSSPGSLNFSLLDSSSSSTETYLLNYLPGPGLVRNSRNVCGKFGGQAHILVPPKWLMFMRRFGVGGYSQGGRGKWQSHINKCFRPFWNSPWQSACHNEIYDWAVAAWNRNRNQQFNLCHANNMSQHCWGVGHAVRFFSEQTQSYK